jgi:pilus assembly protein Flp/PilA
MKSFKSWLQSVRHGEEGVTAIEYALIAVLIAVTIIAGASVLGVNINSAFDNIATQVGAQ